MKKLLLVCLLGMSAVATAQTETAKRAAAGDAKQDARRDEEDAKTRARLDEARQRLDQAAREVAELSTQLGARERGNVLFFRAGGPEAGERRAMLGVQIDPSSGKDGARVQSVSPGGPAADAGLTTGDVIVAIDGKSIAGKDDSYRTLVDNMRDVKPDQKVKVRVLRAGKSKDLVVLARPMAGHTIIRRVGRGEHAPDLLTQDRMPGMNVETFGFGGAFAGEFGGMELASLTPKLGAYFGTNEGVLVVQAPENDAFKLEDGDVIQSIDGRKPEDGAHALRILRSYKPGEKLNVNVLRQRKPLALAVTMPERPDFSEHSMPMPMPFGPMTVSPPMPPLPPTPPEPGVPGAPGALE